MMSASVSAEMPRYRSHKEVHALRIHAIEIHPDQSATITPVEQGFAVFRTRAGWAARYAGTPSDLGLYVVYQDGFASWSPTKAFDEGYSPVKG